ncbi:unnamed protein product [Ectocarpus fasciculatus]
MGPIHGSAAVGAKVESIRTALRELHDHPAHGLQVIMDFDLTMTAPGSEQCHHMFETSPALPENLRRRLAPFFTGEIELTTREAWWEGFHDVLIDAKLTKAQVAAVADGADLALRDGTAELMLLLEERGVPLLVVSAGITDIVAETLRGNGLLLDNVTVRANTMHFGEDGKLERFRESPPVHSRQASRDHHSLLNKDMTAVREKAYFDSNSHRRRLLIVGDKPGDADVNSGFAPDDQCLKIGFFDHSHEHPHPDLPPLPVPPAVTMSAAAPVAAAHNGLAGETATTPEGLGFLGQANRLMLRTTQGTAAAAVQGSRGGAFQLSTTSAEQERIRGRPGSQGGGESFVSEGGVGQDNGQRQQQQQQHETTPVAEEELLRAYGDRFDVVACGGHSMDLVADFVRHFVGDGGNSAAASADAEARRHEYEAQQRASPRKR